MTSIAHKFLRLYTIAYAALRGLKAGRGTIIWPGARVQRFQGGRIEIGPRCEIHPGVVVLSYGGDIRIGENCSVNCYSVLYGHGGLTLGNDIRIAAQCVIIPANHGFTRDGGPIYLQPETRRGIVIGNDVWLGAGARVLDGAVIEDGCVVGAGAVVRGRLRANGVYGGVPARLLRMRQTRSEELEGKSADASTAKLPKVAPAA